MANKKLEQLRQQRLAQKKSQFGGKKAKQQKAMQDRTRIGTCVSSSGDSVDAPLEANEERPFVSPPRRVRHVFYFDGRRVDEATRNYIVRIASLERENMDLQTVIADLRIENGELRVENAELRLKKTELTLQIAELQESFTNFQVTTQNTITSLQNIVEDLQNTVANLQARLLNCSCQAN